MPVAEALERVLSMAQPVSRTETVKLGEAQGRVLASPLKAMLTQPPSDKSAMDGYALRHADIVDGGTLHVVGESAAGHSFSGTVGAGEAVRIFTGANVPEGADTILLQEDAERADDGILRAMEVPAKGRHIRPRGQDFVEGEVVLDAGSLMDASRLMLAASANNSHVEVFAKPVVAIMATGDELVEVGQPVGMDQIVASNNYAIAAIARECGAEVIDLGIVPDSRKATTLAIERAKAMQIDMLVTLGGASVGDHDLVQDALKATGMELDFWRVAMRPGKPIMAGKLGNVAVMGLPGNPVSAAVCGLLFMRPALSRMSHLNLPSLEDDVVVSVDMAENDKRRDHIRATLSRGTDGRLEATPFDKQDSSMMKTYSRSDCLIIREPFAPALNAGETARAIILR